MRILSLQLQNHALGRFGAYTLDALNGAHVFLLTMAWRISPTLMLLTIMMPVPGPMPDTEISCMNKRFLVGVEEAVEGVGVLLDVLVR